MKNKGLIIFLICILTIISILVTLFFVKLLNGNFNIAIFKSVSDTIIEEKEFENIYKEINQKKYGTLKNKFSFVLL